MQIPWKQVIDLVVGQIAFFLTCINQFLNIFFVLVFNSQANPIPCKYFRIGPCSERTGAMRATEGIFRQVRRPFGQLSARRSQSYRISWFGVCPPGDPERLTLSFLRSLMVRCKIERLVSPACLATTSRDAYASTSRSSRSTLTFSAIKTAT